MCLTASAVESSAFPFSLSVLYHWYWTIDFSGRLPDRTEEKNSTGSGKGGFKKRWSPRRCKLKARAKASCGIQRHLDGDSVTNFVSDRPSVRPIQPLASAMTPAPVLSPTERLRASSASLHRPSLTRFLADMLVVTTPDLIASPAPWSLTRCRTCLPLKPLETPETRSNMILKLEKWDVPWQPSDDSRLSPLCTSVYSAAAFVILVDKVLACISLRLLSPAPPPRRLCHKCLAWGMSRAAETDWQNMKIGRQLMAMCFLSAEDNDCVRVRASLHPPLIFSVWIGTCHHILTGLPASLFFFFSLFFSFFMSSVHKIVK